MNGSDIYVYKFQTWPIKISHMSFFMFLHQLDIDDNGDFGSYMLEVVKFGE